MNAKIGVSSIHVGGVGVIAIRDIPKGTTLFERRNQLKGTWVKENDIPLDLRQHVTSFCPAVTVKGVKQCFIPRDGFNAKDISFFMNHSDTPNVHEAPFDTYANIYAETPNGFTIFRAAKNIRKGEELTIDYNAMMDDTINR